jgi:hypothetical protein
MLVALCVSVSFAAPLNDAVPAKKASARKSTVHWMDYNEALEKAQKFPKLVFVDLYILFLEDCIQDTFLQLFDMIINQ